MKKSSKFWNRRWKKGLEGDIIAKTSLYRNQRRIYLSFKKWFSLKDTLIIDVGTGRGQFALELAKDFPKSTIIATDVAKTSIMLAKQGSDKRGYGNIFFLISDLFNLSFLEGIFDVVLVVGVINHFRDYKEAFKKIARLVSKRGKLIVIVSNWYCLIHTVRLKLLGKNYEYGYEKPLKHSELRDLFEKNGLKIAEIEGHWPLHGLYRLSGVYSFSWFSGIVRRVSSFLGIIADVLDKMFNKMISKKFGFFLDARGIKY